MLRHSAYAGNSHTGYRSWCAIAAFFDGDGCVMVNIKENVINIKLEFADNSLPQIEQVRLFLKSRGITTTRVWKAKGGAWEFMICKRTSVITAARKMLNAGGCIFKKRNELIWLLEYYENKITASQFIEHLNDEVRDGNRVGKIREINIPYLYFDGIRKRYLKSALVKRVLTDEQKRQIVIERARGKMTLAELASRYGVSVTTIARAVGNRRDKRRQPSK